jgi:hypothetical protein
LITFGFEAEVRAGEKYREKESIAVDGWRTDSPFSDDANRTKGESRFGRNL